MRIWVGWNFRKGQDIRQKSQSRMITTGRRFGKTYFVIAFINPSTIWSTLKLAGRWLGG